MLSALEQLLSSLFFMKVICWNVQGAKKYHLRQEIAFINHTIKPDILFLLETMVNEQNMELIIRHLGFSQYDTIPIVNHGGNLMSVEFR